MARNDHEAFVRLWVQHQMRLYAYLRSVVFDHAAVEDILQEVAAVAWRRFDEFEAGSHFDRWVFQIARNQVLYYRRKKQRDVLALGEDAVERIADDMTKGDPGGSDYIDALESCLDKLPEDDRDLVQRRYAEGATNRSVASQVGRPEYSVSRAMNRIYLLLLDCIQQTLAIQAVRGGR